MTSSEKLESGAKLFEDGDYRGARDAFSFASGALERDDDKNNLSSALLWLGKSHYKLGEYKEAVEVLTRARELRERLHGADSIATAEADVHLGKAYQEVERADDAINTVAAALEILKDKLGPHNLQVAEASSCLGVLHAAQNNPEAAEPLINRGLGIRRAELAGNDRLIGDSLNDLAYCHSLSGNYTLANVMGRKAVAIREKALGENHPEVGVALYNLATAYVKQHMFGKAEIVARRGLTILKDNLPADHELVIWMSDRLATTCQAMWNRDEAKELHESALASAERKWGKESPKIVNSLIGVGSVYLSRNEYLLAEPYFKRSLHVLGNASALDASVEYSLLQQLSCCYLFQLKLGDTLRLVPDSFRAKHTSDFHRTIDLIKSSVEFVIKQLDRMQKE